MTGSGVYGTPGAWGGDPSNPDEQIKLTDTDAMPDPAHARAEDMRVVVAFTFTHHAAPVHLQDILARIERELTLALGASNRVKVVAHAHTQGRSVGSVNGTMTVVDLLRSFQALDGGAGG